MKNNKLIILLIPALLFACTPKKTDTSSSSSSEEIVDTPTFTFSAAEEVAIDVTKAGVEVLTVDVINIPERGIKVADWDNSNIKLRVSYNDSTTEDFPFMVKHIPLESRHYLGELGHHNIEIMISGHSTKFGFDIIRNPDFPGYRCQFIDSYSQGQMYEVTVGYYQNAIYEGPEFPDHPVGTEYLRAFIGWDYPLDNVHQDMIYNSVYRDTEKRFYGDNLKDGESHVVSTYKDTEDGTISVLTYLGRVHRVALNYGNVVHHQKGDEVMELSLRDLNLFNERWEQLNKDILNYGLQYNYDSTANQHLFGSTTALTVSPMFLSAFETMYSQTSYSVTLDSGIAVTTSSYPNYATVYGLASTHRDDKVSVTSDLESGYYRAAIVCNFDVYASVTFSKLANGKYNLETHSKYMFSPITTSLDVLAQFSETEEFVNTYDKKVELSNKMLLDIAKGLDWGN